MENAKDTNQQGQQNPGSSTQQNSPNRNQGQGGSTQEGDVNREQGGGQRQSAQEDDRSYDQNQKNQKNKGGQKNQDDQDDQDQNDDAGNMKQNPGQQSGKGM